MFKVNDIYYRIDSSREFFQQFEKRNEKVRKKVRLNEFENIEQWECLLHKR